MINNSFLHTPLCSVQKTLELDINKLKKSLVKYIRLNH